MPLALGKNNCIVCSRADEMSRKVSAILQMRGHDNLGGGTEALT